MDAMAHQIVHQIIEKYMHETGLCKCGMSELNPQEGYGAKCIAHDHAEEIATRLGRANLI